MAVSFSSLHDLQTMPFDDIIDVRAPAEFAEDHIPGAISLPVLSDAERARVGTIYVQEDRFLARKIGAALVARNAALHIEGPLSDRDGSWKPLVYCWRGGQRSESFASILKQIGWRVGLVQGGYKSYRRLVVDALYTQPLISRVILISGGTGTGKTEVLGHLRGLGAQVLDLEALANHRGSLFGGTGSTQPSQKMFESQLAASLATMSSDSPIYIEAESHKVGNIILPPSLWRAMQNATRVTLKAPLEERATYLTTLYGPDWQDPHVLLPQLEKLNGYHAKDQIAQWQLLARQGAIKDLAAQLIELHYDPRYTRCTPQSGETLVLNQLTSSSFAQAAARILDMSTL